MALRPDEVEQVEPENEQQPTPSIVVYDPYPTLQRERIGMSNLRLSLFGSSATSSARYAPTTTPLRRGTTTSS